MKKFACGLFGLLFFGSAIAQPLSQTIRQVKPSIVGIATFEALRHPPTRLVGTGFVIGNGRYIATTAHVIPKGLNDKSSEELKVLVGSGHDADLLAAKLIAYNDEYDLAILQVEKRLPALALAVAQPVSEGDEFVFTGFPIGTVLGLYPVTHRGMVSSITPMAIPAPVSSTLSAKKILRLRDPIMVYQLDATAYPGNSGSPLYRPADGMVVGILNQVYVKSTKEDLLSDPSGISYAVPVRYLAPLIERATQH